MNALLTAPEALHPSLWRASQLARARTLCVDTGHPSLSAQLPGGGWPIGTLTELMVQQPGIGELRLLGPALSRVGSKGIVMVDPPHPPQVLGLVGLGLKPSQVIWAKSSRTADGLWAAEQVLRSGSCGVLLFWQNHIRNETLRRLHLAAQHGEALFFIIRPLSAALDASPAALRLSLKPAHGGLDLGFVKRQGPRCDKTLFLPLPMPIKHHLPIQQPRTVIPLSKIMSSEFYEA